MQLPQGPKDHRLSPELSDKLRHLIAYYAIHGELTAILIHMPTDNKAVTEPASDKQHCVKSQTQLVCEALARFSAKAQAAMGLDGVPQRIRFVPYNPHHTCPRCGTDARAGYHLCAHQRSTPISPSQPNHTPVQGFADDDKQ